MTTKNFRVVIAGAGPVGLFMAHALDRTKIDFVILEEQDQVVRHAGAGIGLFPGVLRALDQIGVLEHIPQSPLHGLTDLVTNGVVLRQGPVFDILRDCLGYGPTITSRRDLIEALYTTLPRREERIRTRSKVINVELVDEGVTVRLDDGTTIQGSILIGCDGVHSRVRTFMQQMRQETGEAAKTEEMAIMKKMYAGIYGRIDNPKGIAPGQVFEVHQAGWMMQIFRGEERAWYAVLSNRRQQPDTGKSEPASRGSRYTVEQRDKFAEECSHLLVTPDGLTFGDIWAQTDKASAVMVDQEQGCLDKWHHAGRIVMVGDSQLKVTSATGSGFSTGAESATVLANELHGLLAGVADGVQPSAQSLDAAFGRYQETRMAVCKKILREDQSRMERSVWSSWFWWLLDRWVLRPPLFDLNKVIREQMVPQMASAPVLSYIPFEGMAGSTAWTMVQAKA